MSDTSFMKCLEIGFLGLGFCQEWPPRSPDLTPCDFFLWGHIKNQVYSSPPATLEILRERIESEFDRLKEQAQQIRRVVRAMRKQAGSGA